MVRLVDISRVFGRGKAEIHALRGVSAHLPAGTLTAIVGPSGSGKSTLLNIVAALDHPSSGQVLVEGRDLAAMSETERTLFRRARVGFVFQSFNLLPALSALENVALVPDLAGVPARQGRARATHLLERVGLSHRLHHRPDELSGGEMQRVAIARALTMDPPLVVADEPTGNLDTKAGDEVLDLLRSTVSGQRTVVLVTHDPRIASRADRVLTMRDGALASEEAA
jgi:ABC-type lipoprotein export system ATPase subunit